MTLDRPMTLRPHLARWRESGCWANVMQALATAESTRLPAPSELNTRIGCGETSASGLTSSTSTSPAATSAWTVSHSSVLAELMVRARMPARSAASIWLRIKARSGETITVGPLPRFRSSAVATKYTADFPQPVRCTTSARRPWATSASTARHWSSRSRVVPVGSPTRRARTESAAVRSSVVVVSVMPPCNAMAPTSRERRRRPCG
jgi:hypothetical protein